MYKKIKPTSSKIRVNNSYEGETIEQKINRIVNNKEPITDSADLIYTDRADGVLPAYDIRTDKMEIALEAMDVATKTHIAKREERRKAKIETTDSAKTETKNIEGGQSPANTSDKL